METLKKTFGNKDEEDQSLLSNIGDATTLSWSTRIKAFLVCFVLGFVMSLLGSALLFLSSNGLTLFAIFYTLGNVFSISSTCFLMGPLKQVKKMFEQKRLIATSLVILFLALTLCAALWWKIQVLAILFCICQFFALIWYSISYIPFARDAVKKVASNII